MVLAIAPPFLSNSNFIDRILRYKGVRRHNHIWFIFNTFLINGEINVFNLSKDLQLLV